MLDTLIIDPERGDPLEPLNVLTDLFDHHWPMSEIVSGHHDGAWS